MSNSTKIPQPLHTEIICPSGRKIIRIDKLQHAFWYDNAENNPNSIFVRECSNFPDVMDYVANKYVLTEHKRKILRKAQESLNADKDLQELVHKSKTEKRKGEYNKFVGNFLPVQYSAGAEKIFSRMKTGKTHPVINMAFQVGTFYGGNYTGGFIKILKTILAAQALGVRLNIDMFDSDTRAVSTSNNGSRGYIIVNAAKSTEKLNLQTILATSHAEFFNYTLFNSYSAQGLHNTYHIGKFLNTDEIVEDLSPYYDVIGGNLIQRDHAEESKKMVSTIIKIASK